MQGTFQAGSSIAALHEFDPRLLLDSLEKLPAGVIVMDALFCILYANEAARRISRIEPEHIGRKTHWELFPETLGSVIETSYRRVVSNKAAEVLPDFYYAPFSVWVRVQAVPVGDGLAIYYRDVTEEHRLAEEKRASDDRLKLALEAVNSVGVWDWDITNDRVYVDEHFARIYGVDPAQGIAGTPIADFIRNIHPEDTPTVGELIAEAQRTGGEFVAEYRILQADGTYRWIATRGRVILDDTGKAVRFPGVAVDITQQKQTEAALIQSEKLAAVGRLANSIAHEINNPLEAVTNLLYLSRQCAIVPEVQGYLDLADQELRRVSLIANQTLRFHKQASLPTETTAAELFQNVLSLYEGKLRNSGVKVEQSSHEKRSIFCFEGDVRQVLSNLISNSLDAMQSGGRLLLRSHEATDWRSRRKGLMLTIADTGNGISAKDQSRIFEAFFTTKGFNGTGLGLWISGEIMERHSGYILMRSKQGDSRHGTVTSLFLPFEPTPKPTAHAASSLVRTL